MIYFVLTAAEQGIDFVPPHPRRIQLSHPNADDPARPTLGAAASAGRFFETFHVLVKPVYASKYFPGTALLYAPGLAIGLPVLLLPALVSGGVVGLVYRIIAELTRWCRRAAWRRDDDRMHALCLASVLYMSAAPIMLLTMLANWAYLHWRRSPKTIWGTA